MTPSFLLVGYIFHHNNIYLQKRRHALWASPMNTPCGAKQDWLGAPKLSQQWKAHCAGQRVNQTCPQYLRSRPWGFQFTFCALFFIFVDKI